MKIGRRWRGGLRFPLGFGRICRGGDRFSVPVRFEGGYLVLVPGQAGCLLCEGGHCLLVFEDEGFRTSPVGLGDGAFEFLEQNSERRVNLAGWHVHVSWVLRTSLGILACPRAALGVLSAGGPGPVEGPRTSHRRSGRVGAPFEETAGKPHRIALAIEGMDVACLDRLEVAS